MQQSQTIINAMKFVKKFLQILFIFIFILGQLNLYSMSESENYEQESESSFSDKWNQLKDAISNNENIDKLKKEFFKLCKSNTVCKAEINKARLEVKKLKLSNKLYHPNQDIWDEIIEYLTCLNNNINRRTMKESRKKLSTRQQKSSNNIRLTPMLDEYQNQNSDKKIIDTKVDVIKGKNNTDDNTKTESKRKKLTEYVPLGLLVFSISFLVAVMAKKIKKSIYNSKFQRKIEKLLPDFLQKV